MLLASGNNNPGGNSGSGSNSSNKRARQFSPDQPIRSVVFELFEGQKYWTVKHLTAAAAVGGAVPQSLQHQTSNHNSDSTTTSSSNHQNALEREIRDVLKEIGDYHRSGEQKTMWELKKEFQQQS